MVVTLDTTRADRLGCYGHAAAVTPHLDALAARGTRFTRTVAPAPLTIPTHASLWTGLYPSRHGVHDNGDQHLAPQAWTLAERLQARGWRTAAVVGAWVTAPRWGFDQGFDRYDAELGVPADRLGWRVERPADEVIDRALATLDEGTDLLWVHLFDAHAPYAPPPPFDALADPYDGELAFVDAQLGRLLQALPAETTVIVAGDHGEGLGEGGEAEHGLLLSDGVLAVPLLVAGPGVPVAVDPRPASVVDVLPTVLARAGLPPDRALDGQDLLSPPDRPGVLSEARHGEIHYGWTALTAVTTPTGRLVRGARDEVVGQVDDAARALLAADADRAPDWAPQPLTLDREEFARLEALGYLAAPAGAAEGVDPRDGIHALLALRGDPPPGDAVAWLRARLAEQPRMHHLRIRLAALLADRGDLEGALAEVTSAHRGSPTSTAATLAGELWLERGQAQEAEAWLREALALDPLAAPAQAALVRALAAAGQVDEAAL
ncbi:sulfatase-like hydrolase/transferase, partial [Myxococcota bacterium]|nr:sulfatase-like hydrolase/transferase [Myxococcota bacterium]